MISKIVFKTLLFYWQKTALTVSLVALLLFLVFSSWLFTSRIQALSDQPLDSLSTELVLQYDSVDKDANDIQTSGIIEPFNLQTFPNGSTVAQLSEIAGVESFSTALLLWQFDIQNNKTIVGVDVNDRLVGLRKVEEWLMPGSNFFNSNDSEEVILERHFAKLFGHKIGEAYQIEDKEYAIVGIVDFTEQSNLVNAQIFMPYYSALALLGEEEQLVNQLYLSLENASELSRVQEEISVIHPELSIITKDTLLKNLSTFNALVYRFGNYFVLGIFILSGLLAFWVLKMNHLEFGAQSDILHMIGWPKNKIQQWIFVESSYLVIAALVVSLLCLAIFYWGVIPQTSIDTFFNQNFEL